MSIIWEQVRANRTPYLLILPAVLLMLVLTLYPALYVIQMSFTNLELGRLGSNYIGLRNYLDFFRQPITYRVLLTTLIFMGGVSALAIGVGMGIALLVNCGIHFQRTFRSIAIIPWTLTAVIAGAMWRWLLAPTIGITPYIFDHFFDIKVSFFLRANLSMLSLILVETWRSSGYAFIFILAGLQGIDPTLREAADIDGASSWQKFWHITFALLLPTLLITLILMTIRTLGLVAIVLIVTGGGPFRSTETLAFHVWQETFHYYNVGYGSAVAVILLIFTLLLAIIYFKVLGKKGMGYA